MARPSGVRVCGCQASFFTSLNFSAHVENFVIIKIHLDSRRRELSIGGVVYFMRPPQHVQTVDPQNRGGPQAKAVLTKVDFFKENHSFITT